MAEIEQLNHLFAQELGRTLMDQPVYKWAFVPDLRLIRYERPERRHMFNWKLIKLKPLEPAPGETLVSDLPERPVLWVPSRPFERVPAFPQLGDRWCVARHMVMPPEQWERLFGDTAIQPPGGYYVPTDVVMKPGYRPTEEWTWHWIHQIKLSRSRSAAEYERHVEAEIEREDQQNQKTILDMVENLLTVRGGKPGSRSGGVSIFSEPLNKETKVENDSVVLPKAA